MSAGKTGCLVVYVVLALLALSEAGTTVGTLAIWALLVVAVVHSIEMVIFLPLCRQSSGSLPANLLQVFLFGYFHMIEMKAQS